MATRERVIWALGLTALVAVAVLAPSLPPMVLLPISIAWLGCLVALAVGASRLLSRSWGRWPTGAAAAIMAAAVVALFGVDWAGSAGTYLPCRRNWLWLPSYLLRSSPTESVTAVVDTVRVKICYGSPRARGRKMIGGSAVPFGRLWRTGANEPTTIRLSAPVVIAGTTVDQDKLSLYTVPGPETWEIVLNRSTKQWGIESLYPDGAAEELGRAVVTSRQSAAFVEALELTVEPTSRADSAEIVLRWENTEVRIPLTTASGGR